MPPGEPGGILSSKRRGDVSGHLDLSCLLAATAAIVLNHEA